MGGLKGGQWGLNMGALAIGRYWRTVTEKCIVSAALSIVALPAEPAPQWDIGSQLAGVSAGSWSQQSIGWLSELCMLTAWE